MERTDFQKRTFHICVIPHVNRRHTRHFCADHIFLRVIEEKQCIQAYASGLGYRLE